MDLFKILRIITFYLRINEASQFLKINIHFFDELNSNNPYSLAKEFNINEINNLTEFSRLFLAYMQLDSYVLFNYYINQPSFSFSMEPLNLLKYHLKSNYEEFFFTTREEEMDRCNFQAADEKLTVINEKKLFQIGNFDESITEIKEISESINYAFPISMEFRYEKNGYQKNTDLLSPQFFFRDLKYEKIEYEEKNTIKGGNGKIIESFISPDTKKLEDLKTKLIYGELLDWHLFTQKNFKDLFSKIDVINLKNKSKDESNEIDKEKTLKMKEKEKMYKRYKELGFYIIGDVVYSKNSMESIRYYEDYELEYKPKFPNSYDDHKDD